MEMKDAFSQSMLPWAKSILSDWVKNNPQVNGLTEKYISNYMENTYNEKRDDIERMFHELEKFIKVGDAPYDVDTFFSDMKDLLKGGEEKEIFDNFLGRLTTGNGEVLRLDMKRSFFKSLVFGDTSVIRITDEDVNILKNMVLSKL